MKTDALFKKIFNDMLDNISANSGRSALNSEAHLADLFQISRTTIRKVLSELDRRQLIAWDGKHPLVLRRPKKEDYFPHADTLATSDLVEKKIHGMDAAKRSAA